MNSLKINQSSTTIKLSPEQCSQIAKGLDLASEHAPHDQALVDVYRVFSMLFQACAIAAQAQLNLPAGNWPDLASDLAALGLAEEEDTVS